jgi:hypothetical protein
MPVHVLVAEDGMLVWFRCVAFVLLLMPASASAQVIMSHNSRPANGMDVRACMQRGSDVFRSERMRQFATTEEGVWAWTPDGRYMTSVYCPSGRDTVVFSAAGAQGNVTHSLVEDMTKAWDRAR